MSRTVHRTPAGKRPEALQLRPALLYTTPMRFAPLLLLTPLPALAAHTGVAAERTGFAPSDVALFLVAAAGLWIARRALRARRKPPRD